jgi:hypothetical protein
VLAVLLFSVNFVAFFKSFHTYNITLVEKKQVCIDTETSAADKDSAVPVNILRPPHQDGRYNINACSNNILYIYVYVPTCFLAIEIYFPFQRITRVCVFKDFIVSSMRCRVVK